MLKSPSDKVSKNNPLVVSTLHRADFLSTMNMILMLTYPNAWTKKRIDIHQEYRELCFTIVTIKGINVCSRNSFFVYFYLLCLHIQHTPSLKIHANMQPC